MAALLRARDLMKGHGHRPVLRSVTLDVKPGEVVAVTGANGAGKTTLLRILATLDRPGGGTLELFGLDPWEAGPEVRARTGYAGHRPGLYPELTVRENLRFFLSFHPSHGDRGQRAAAVTRALHELGLSALADAPARRLSRGEQQRTALARAIAHDPDLLLLDEPYTGLDAEGATALDGLLAAARAAGKVVVFTTHGPGLPLADRALNVQDGRLHAREEVASP